MWFIHRLVISRASSTFRLTSRLRHSKYVPTRASSNAASPKEKTKAAPVVTEELRNAWKAVAPLLEFPKIPSNFLKERPPVPATIPTKLTINFMLPRKFEIQGKEVDMVIVPATTGMMGVLPGHVPTIAELNPGVLTIHDGSKVDKYIISGGVAVVHANSVADILVVEACVAENLDIEEAKKGLAEYTAKLNSATTDLAKAEAQIAVEVYGRLIAALS